MPMFFLHANDFLRILSSTTCRTARILSICILLLSLAPLGSIYVLLFSLGIFGVVVREQGDGLNLSSALHQSQSQNMTLDNVWSILIQEYGSHSKGHHGLLVAFLPLGQQHLSTHLRIFLPWALSFFVGVIVPTAFSVWSFLRNKRILVERKKRREKRLDMATRLIRDEYSKQLTKDDLLIELDDAQQQQVDDAIYSNDGSLLDERDSLKWIVPIAGSSIRQPTQSTRIVDQGCAICLHTFRLDDSVCWSSNTACMHTFHEQCILEWLSRKRNKKFACPCCRQCFILVPAEAAKSSDRAAISDAEIHTTFFESHSIYR